MPSASDASQTMDSSAPPNAPPTALSAAETAALLDLCFAWHWEQDASLRFSWASPESFAACGLPAEEVIGRRLWELPLVVVDPESLAEHQEACHRHLPFRDFSFRLRGNDGRIRLHSASAVPLHAPDGSFLGYRGVCRDEGRIHSLMKEAADAERRLLDFVNAGEYWLWEQDSDFRFSNFWGLSAAKVLISPADMIGKRRWELGLEGVSPEQMAAHRATVEAHRPFERFEYMTRTADGVEEWRSISGRPLFDESGRFAGFRGVGRNITREKRNEFELHRQSQLISAMHETLRGLIGGHDIACVLEAIVRHAMALADAETGYLYMVDAENNRLDLRVAVGAVKRFAGTTLAPGEGLSGIVWQTGRPLVVNNYTQWSWRSAKYADSGIEAIAGVPLNSGSGIKGVIGVLYMEPNRRFEDVVIAHLETFAPLAALALEKVTRIQELEQRITGLNP